VSREVLNKSARDMVTVLYGLFLRLDTEQANERAETLVRTMAPPWLVSECESGPAGWVDVAVYMLAQLAGGRAVLHDDEHCLVVARLDAAKAAAHQCEL
jgi:hypothetical protein